MYPVITWTWGRLVPSHGFLVWVCYIPLPPASLLRGGCLVRVVRFLWEGLTLVFISTLSYFSQLRCLDIR